MMRNRPLDRRRLASVARGPGIDTRVWICEAVVVDIGFDAAEGVFVDVRILPDDLPETCRVGLPYAGNGFGAWFPFEIDDVVLVAVPGGDSNNGPVIIGRMWNACDQPPADARGLPVTGGTAPTTDTFIRTKPGAEFKIRTSGAGAISIISEGAGDVTVQQKGTGNIILKVESTHKVFIGDETATEPVALGQVLATWMGTLRTWLNTHIHTIPGPASTTAPTILLGVPPNVKATKGFVK